MRNWKAGGQQPVSLHFHNNNLNQAIYSYLEEEPLETINLSTVTDGGTWYS